jgi:hypothetical protein
MTPSHSDMTSHLLRRLPGAPAEMARALATAHEADVKWRKTSWRRCAGRGGRVRQQQGHCRACSRVRARRRRSAASSRTGLPTPHHVSDHSLFATYRTDSALMFLAPVACYIRVPEAGLESSC